MGPPRPDIAAAVQRIEPRARRSPLHGHEHQRGWGVLACPFASGHVLALRVSPQNDFAPFTSIWHRTPDGAWSIYVDGPRLDTACPRYWSAATDHVQMTDISLEWSDPHCLDIEMSAPPLRWTVSMRSGPLVSAVNAVTARLPEPVLRWRPAIRCMERLGDRLFELGDITLTTPVPNGQHATVVTRQLFPIVDGEAHLDGVDLGRPATGDENPTFGAARLPARPLFTIGPGYLTILDTDEYEQRVAEMRQAQDPQPTGGSVSVQGRAPLEESGC